MEINDKNAKKINSLIIKNIDAHKGYNNAAAQVSDMHLRDFFASEATQRKRFAEELNKALKSYNPKSEDETDGSITESLHRTWMDIKAALSMNDDKSILEECLRGEKASVEEYKDYLSNYSGYNNLDDLIEKQLDRIRLTLDQVKSLEDLA